MTARVRPRWTIPLVVIGALILVVVGLQLLDGGSDGGGGTGTADDPAATSSTPPPTLSKVPVPLGTEVITKAEYDQITNGLTYDEVEAIAGGPGHLSSRVEGDAMTTEIFTWDGNGPAGSNANVSFEAGHVTSKAQYALT
jgi:hypothetical protein